MYKYDLALNKQQWLLNHKIVAATDLFPFANQCPR